jgi:hypothetical protein
LEKEQWFSAVRKTRLSLPDPNRASPMADYALEKLDPEALVGDFEFRLFSNAMLPAKELFSDEFRLVEIREKKKKKTLPDFAGIQPSIAGIIVEVRQNHCLRSFWKKKQNQKWSRASFHQS